ncbi:hypothetical protein JKP76_11520 [Blastococcus sp. TML/C7B]|nr:hypothetical protein [Blastococcus sp. TML/C7B]MBN1096608.1 hypothetical protein [Blastococcus sp. TML/C7B]
MEVGQLVDPRGEGHDEQEGEEELDTGQSHPELVEQLHELAVDPLLPGLAVLGHLVLLAPAYRPRAVVA